MHRVQDGVGVGALPLRGCRGGAFGATVAGMSRIAFAALALVPSAASAADRSVGIGSFERLRVDGPFLVTVATGRSPGARISGGQADILDVEVRSEGGTLIVRRSATGRWGERGASSATAPVTVALSTPALSGAAVIGGGKVTIDRMKGPRVDLSLTGSGALALAALDAQEVRVQLVGPGSLALAGKAATARLMTNGPGTIDAAGLDAGDLVVGLDGLGQTSARARYTAQVSSTGLGTISIAGRPKCVVRALSSAPISCGDAPASGR